MVKKIQKPSTGKKATAATFNSPLSGAIKDSAQQIWLAGLGAFSKAQEEGGKAFESLVKEGLSIQRKTQAVAEERISEATNRMSSMATDISSKAAGQWDKLENIFEDRVAKALNKLGVPSARDIESLMERIDTLSQAVHRLSGEAPVKTAAKARAKARAKVTPPPAARKAAAKSPAKAPAKAAVKAPVTAAVKAPAKTVSRKTATKTAPGKAVAPKVEAAA
ncbi:MAG: phasin family protein [Hydrogenophaga sp.]|uniref:phasin family protein n=1 Tax=Hydrogenophaga sp. TaxID=1904254 RepID=UPI002723ADF6|nr:phasin family protein [Hydrogenophaga sp.]MDO9147930.1 phasin family protein [Hydrogenophaga sp.]MDO9604287.1 phasin family protein [Hydrogenophaga sp.]MDP2165710.1 phasin family protein [Hydrogenophaga sp.]MDP3474552.1 phasin family protein [Hydrogenophaga sp.]